MTPAETKSFLDQFAKAGEEVARLKATVPHIFEEWQALKAAEDELARAQLKLQLAQQRWEKL